MAARLAESSACYENHEFWIHLVITKSELSIQKKINPILAGFQEKSIDNILGGGVQIVSTQPRRPENSDNFKKLF